MPKIKKLKLPCKPIECWANPDDVGGWDVTADAKEAKRWINYGWKVIKGTFIPHKEGKHGLTLQIC